MANLACVGSLAINGVAALHTKLLKETVLRDFHDLWPEARIDMVTLFVTGQHQLPPKELPSKKKVPQVELWLGIYIHSAEPIPNLPRGLSKEGLAGTFVFVHPADSVRTHSHSTLVSALYSGNDPPTIPP